MKRLVSVFLAMLMLSSAVACGKTDAGVSGSATSSAEEIMTERLGGVPENVVLGDATVAASYGIDMSDFDDDGYIVRTVNGQTLVLGKTEDALDRAARYYVKNSADGEAPDDKVYGEGAKVKSLLIGGRSVSEFVITVTEEHPEGSYPESTEYASTELARLIGEATDVTVPIVPEAELEDGVPYIRLTCDGSGDNGEEGFTVTVTPEGNIEIMGGLKRGCLYAVYDIAEEWLGMRFIAYDYTYIYEADEISITEANSYSDAPKMNMRYPVNYTSWWQDNTTAGFAEYPYFAAIHKINGFPNEAKYGYEERISTSHGIWQYWGVGATEKNQCYTDEDINQQVIDGIKKVLEAAKESGMLYVGNRYNVTIGHNDNSTFCECSDCMQVAEEEGSYSGNIVRQANMLAEYFVEEYPQVMFSVFAYWGTERPCKTSLNDHVSIEYCVIYPCYGGPLDGSECRADRVGFRHRSAADEKYNIEGWAKLAKYLDVRLYYFTRSFNKPNNVLNHLYADMKYMYDMGVRNLFVEIEHEVPDFDFHYPASYLMAKLMWDPTMSEEEYIALRDELFLLTYGEGYECILKYLEIYNTFFVCTDGEGWGAQFDFIKIDAYSEYALGLFDTAELLASSAREAYLVRMLKVHVVYNAICVWYESKTLNGTTEEKAYMAELYDELKALFDESHVTSLTAWNESRIDAIDWDGDPFDWTPGWKGDRLTESADEADT